MKFNICTLIKWNFLTGWEFRNFPQDGKFSKLGNFPNPGNFSGIIVWEIPGREKFEAIWEEGNRNFPFEHAWAKIFSVFLFSPFIGDGCQSQSNARLYDETSVG